MTKNNKLYNDIMNRYMSVVYIHKAVDLLNDMKNGKSIDEHEFDNIAFDLNYILNRLKTKNKCPKCGSYLYLSDLEDYDYVCGDCDQNFYDCEIK